MQCIPAGLRTTGETSDKQIECRTDDFPVFGKRTEIKSYCRTGKWTVRSELAYHENVLDMGFEPILGQVSNFVVPATGVTVKTLLKYYRIGLSAEHHCRRHNDCRYSDHFFHGFSLKDWVNIDNIRIRFSAVFLPYGYPCVQSTPPLKLRGCLRDAQR
jgi:hypothetical protein